MIDGSLAESVASVDFGRPAVNQTDAELALWQHLSAIGAETDSFTWVEDIEEGFARARDIAGQGHRFWAPSTSGSWNRFSLWNPDAAISYPDRELARRRDSIGKPIFRAARGTLSRRWRVRKTTRSNRTWRESFKEVPDPVSVYRLALSAVDEAAVVGSGRPDRGDFGELDRADRDWQQVARQNSAFERATRTYESACYRLGTLEPLVRAWEGGVLGFWVTEGPRWRQRSCIVVPRPVLHVSSDRLHRTDGPAVDWPTGVSYWFSAGVPIPKRVVAKQSERARLQVLLRAADPVLRHRLLEQLGNEHFLDLSGRELIQQDDYGKLWRSTICVDGERLHVVEVVNSTPDPGGSHNRSFLSVPPTTKTAREGVARTSNLDSLDWRPVIRT